MENSDEETPRERDDFYEDRDRDRPQRRRSSGWLIWVVLALVGGGLLLLCIGGGVVLVVWGVRDAMKEMPAATAVSDQFFGALQRGKTDEAYALTNAKFRAEQSQEQFDRYVKKFETFTHHTSRTQNGFKIFHDASGKHAYIQMTLHSPTNAMTCTLVLIEEGGSWKVEKVTVP